MQLTYSSNKLSTGTRNMQIDVGPTPHSTVPARKCGCPLGTFASAFLAESSAHATLGLSPYRDR